MSARAGVVTIVGIIAVIVVWVVINKSAGGTFECLDVGLSCACLASAECALTLAARPASTRVPSVGLGVLTVVLAEGAVAAGTFRSCPQVGSPTSAEPLKPNLKTNLHANLETNNP